MQPEQYTIGRLAQAGGVNVETIRYYQRRRLLAVPARRAQGFRYYGPETLGRLRFIRRAQALGLSLATAERYWTYARLWLYAELTDEDRQEE